MLQRLLPHCTSANGTDSSDLALAEAVDRIAARLRRGERVDIEHEIAGHPECADGLRVLWPMLEALASSQTANRKTLGDFELIREVGRGGMGIVYEAWQRSLDRRVAVKVLPAASLLDERQLQRFQNEARAAAQLNHPHIVDCFWVGCDDGVHYFAMRFIEGRTLAEIIVDGETEGQREGERDGGAINAKCKLQNAKRKMQNDASGGTLDSGYGDPKTQGLKPNFSIQNPKSKIQNCTGWIAQAAEALEHAHLSGIVHRDIKPSNLLVDRDGKLWVTDFGVARFGGDAALTLTGDLLGTLRYMSPEQALGRLASIGPSSDVYSLGATLYELLAARPVFDGDDRGELLRQIAFELPIALRTHNPRLPRDLETIALKSLEKSPEDRYTSAGEMAADLRRFLRGEPIHAKPPTLAQRAFKWSLRHRRLVAGAALALLLVLAGLSVSTLLIARSRNEALVAQELLEDRDRENRRMLSAVETRLALQAYQRGDLDQASELLDRQVARSRTREMEDGLPSPSSQSGDGLGRPSSEEDFRDFTWHWLRGAIRSRLPIVSSFDDYPSEVYSVDYSPDGALMATATYRKIIVHDVLSGEIQYTIDAHASDVDCARFSPDGKLLASVGDDCHVRLWRASGGQPVADLGSHEPNPVLCAAFSPDGRLLATGGDQGSVRIWNVPDRSEFRRFPHGGRVESVLFVDRGTLLVVIADAQMTAWDVETGEARWRVVGPAGPFLSLAASPNGATIATGDHYGAVGLFSAVHGRSLGSFGGRQTKIQSVAFSRDGKLLAAGGHDGVAQLWDVAAQTYCGETAKHSQRLWSVTFSPDGRTLATASRDRSVKRWDVAARLQPRREKLDAGSLQIAFSDVEQTLGFFQDLRLVVWPRGSANSRPVQGKDKTHGYESPLGWAAGKWFLCRSDGDRRAFEVTRDEVCLVRTDAKDVNRLVLTPDGQWLALRGPQGIEIWHVPSERPRYDYVGNPPVFTANGEAFFNQHLQGPNGRYGRIMRLKLDNFESPAREFYRNEQVEVMALSPDDRILAIGNVDSTIELVEVANHASRRLVGHERGVWTLAFSADGRTLASGGADGTVRLWRVDVAESLGILERRTNGGIHQVKFSPDGLSLAAAGRDGLVGAVSLWEIDP